MPRALRRIIFIFFVLLFFISSTILLFYASGYRYHAGKRVVEKTGKLIVETKPRGAQVHIDGVVLQSLVTPTSISYLLSGEYEISIEKEGYFPVSKHVSIAPGVSTVINDVVLIKKDAPRLLVPTGSVKEVLARGDTLFAHDGKGMYAFDVISQRWRELITSSDPITEMRVSESGAVIALKTKRGWGIYNQGGEIFFEKENQPSIVDVRFAQGSDDAYARTTRGIVRFDAAKRMFVPLVNRQDVVSFYVTDSSLFLLREPVMPAKVTTLDEIELPGAALKRTISDLPTVTSILESSDGILVLQGPGQSVYLFDARTPQATFQQVSDARSVMFTNRERFFSFNDFEIWEHQFSRERYGRSLMTRRSNAIAAIMPFKTRQLMIVVAKNGELHLLRPGARESTELLLATFESVARVALNQKEDTLFIVGSLNGKQGIYTLTLVEEEQVFPLVK